MHTPFSWEKCFDSEVNKSFIFAYPVQGTVQFLFDNTVPCVLLQVEHRP